MLRHCITNNFHIQKLRHRIQCHNHYRCEQRTHISDLPADSYFSCLPGCGCVTEQILEQSGSICESESRADQPLQDKINGAGVSKAVCTRHHQLFNKTRCTNYFFHQTQLHVTQKPVAAKKRKKHKHPLMCQNYIDLSRVYHLYQTGYEPQSQQ